MTDAVGNLSTLLQRTEVTQHNVVSFKGQGLKLNTAGDADCIVEAMRKAPDLQVNGLSFVSIIHSYVTSSGLLN